MTPDAVVETSFYVQLKPLFGRSWKPDEVTGLKAVKMSQKKPECPESGCFVVKIRVSAEKDVFAVPEVNVFLQNTDARVAVSELQTWIQKP